MPSSQAFQASIALFSSTPNNPQVHPHSQLDSPRSQLPRPSPAKKHIKPLPRRAFLTSILSLPLLSQSNYDNYAQSYDNLDGFNPLTTLLGLTDLRRRLLAQAHGHVLETGVGTGLNLPLYDSSRISSLTALDISEGMLTFARQRSANLSLIPDIRLLRASVDDTGLESNSFDTVVDTFSLCVYPQPLEALKEMKRVTKEGGRVLLLEHTRSTNALLAAYQDITANATAAMSKGCYPNQNVLAMVRSLSFRVIRSELHVGGSVIYLELGI